MTYCVDSSAWIEYFGGTKTGLRLKPVLEQENLVTSIMAVAEVADKFEREQKNFRHFLTFMQSRATILSLTITTCTTGATIKNELRKTRRKFGLADGLHLATAREHNATLITTDNDFFGIEGAVVY